MFARIVGISAALAAIFVVALEVPVAQSRTPAKVLERAPTATAPEAPVRHASAEPTMPATAPEAPRVVPGATPRQLDCRRQAWPYQDPGCGTAERRPVRTITIERREGMNTSNLIRLPADDQ